MLRKRRSGKLLKKYGEKQMVDEEEWGQRWQDILEGGE